MRERCAQRSRKVERIYRRSQRVGIRFLYVASSADPLQVLSVLQLDDGVMSYAQHTMFEKAGRKINGISKNADKSFSKLDVKSRRLASDKRIFEFSYNNIEVTYLSYNIYAGWNPK